MSKLFKIFIFLMIASEFKGCYKKLVILPRVRQQLNLLINTIIILFLFIIFKLK